MKFQSIAILAAAIIAPALAQSSTPTAAAPGATHTVTVGKAGLTFDPPSIQAAVGDVVSFVFYPKAHSVTQSTFGQPCSLLQNATSAAVGFDSGFVPVTANATTNPVWSIQVTGVAPIWYYCKQGTHCVAGMVGAINAPTTGNTFDKFLAAAKTGNGTSAGASGNPSGGPGATASAGPTTIPNSSSGSGSGTGAASHHAAPIAAIMVGGVAAIFASFF